MNREIARKELHTYLEKFRARSYKELTQLLDEPQRDTVVGEDGTAYEIEVQIRWEKAPGGDVRVVGLIDDKRLVSAILPVSRDFIVTPEGEVLD
jgi:hypothetical protein